MVALDLALPADHATARMGWPFGAVGLASRNEAIAQHAKIRHNKHIGAFMRHWYALQVTSGTELALISPYMDWGGDVTAYTPVEVIHQRRAKGESTIKRPIFVGYVFVQADLSQSATCARVITTKSRGRFVLGQDGFPAKVRACDVENLQEQEAIGAFDKVKAMSERFASLIGKRHTLKDGPLEGWTVTITEATSRDTVKAVGDWNGKPVTVGVKVTADMLGVAA